MTSHTVAPVMWMELEVSPALALAQVREEVVESMLVVSATVVVERWPANEVVELLMHWEQFDLYAEEVAAVERPVECADMGTAEGLYEQNVGNDPGGTVAAAMGLGIQSVTL